jgi:hypothetical protein
MTITCCSGSGSAALCFTSASYRGHAWCGSDTPARRSVSRAAPPPPRQRPALAASPSSVASRCEVPSAACRMHAHVVLPQARRWLTGSAAAFVPCQRQTSYKQRFYCFQPGHAPSSCVPWCGCRCQLPTAQPQLSARLSCPQRCHQPMACWHTPLPLHQQCWETSACIHQNLLDLYESDVTKRLGSAGRST